MNVMVQVGVYKKMVKLYANVYVTNNNKAVTLNLYVQNTKVLIAGHLNNGIITSVVTQ